MHVGVVYFVSSFAQLLLKVYRARHGSMIGLEGEKTECRILYVFCHDGKPEHLVSVDGHSLFGDRVVTAFPSTTTGGCTMRLAYIALLWYLVDTLPRMLYFSVLLITAALSTFVQPHNSTPCTSRAKLRMFVPSDCLLISSADICFMSASSLSNTSTSYSEYALDFLVLLTCLLLPLHVVFRVWQTVFRSAFRKGWLAINHLRKRVTDILENATPRQFSALIYSVSARHHHCS